MLPLTFFSSSITSRVVVAGMLCMLLGLCTTQRSAAQPGEAAVLFLLIEPDSRGAGMGNAGVAIADNANAVFWNPAGLAFQEGAGVSVTHSPWLAELNAGLYYDYLVGKYQVDGIGTFGGHVTYLFLGEQNYTSPSGDNLGTFKSHDLSVGLSFARKLGNQLSLGGGVRYIYSDLAGGVEGIDGTGTAPGKTYALDLAALYRSHYFDLFGVNTQASVGLNLANMGPTIEYGFGDDDTGAADPIPQSMRAGYALTFELDEYNTLTFANDFSKVLVDRDSTEIAPFYEAIFSSWQAERVQNPEAGEEESEFTTLTVFEQIMIGGGLEYWYNQLFALRSGFFYEAPENGGRQFITFGAGLRYNIVGVDFSYIYALKENHPLANTMRFSLVLNFGE